MAHRGLAAIRAVEGADEVPLTKPGDGGRSTVRASAAQIGNSLAYWLFARKSAGLQDGLSPTGPAATWGSQDFALNNAPVALIDPISG